MKAVIESYENYQEDLRLNSDNSRRLEYLTGIAYMDKFFEKGWKILDVAAGTGAYALHYAEKGLNVTACDITPAYVDILKEKAQKSGVRLPAYVNDARDLSIFPDNAFDCVLCMGPIYHLTEAEDRAQVLRECVRVLKPGGLLYVAYINKLFVFYNLALGSRQYLQEKWFQKIVINQEIRSNESDCFWTDAWFTTPQEIESMVGEFGLEKVAHVAQDGVEQLRGEDVNAMPVELFNKWVEFHIRTCEEPGLLGISNHGLYIARKNDRT